MIDGEWIAEQLRKYVTVLDQFPQSRAGKVGEAHVSPEYVAGLRDMAGSIIEGIEQESDWQSLREMVPNVEGIPEHGWEVMLVNQQATEREGG